MSNRGEDVAATQPAGDEPQAEQGAVAGTATEQELDVLRAQLEEEKARAEKYLANWQRAEADLSNFRRRADQERAELVKFANASLIGKLLPVLDDFERALAAIPEEQRSLGWVEGLRLIDRKLRTILEQEGVTAVEALGKEFDPRVHEAVLTEEGEGDLDVVVQELQKGYRLHDRLLRPTMVKVGKRSSSSDQVK